MCWNEEKKGKSIKYLQMSFLIFKWKRRELKMGERWGRRGNCVLQDETGQD